MKQVNADFLTSFHGRVICWAVGMLLQRSKRSRRKALNSKNLEKLGPWDRVWVNFQLSTRGGSILKHWFQRERASKCHFLNWKSKIFTSFSEMCSLQMLWWLWTAALGHGFTVGLGDLREEGGTAVTQREYLDRTGVTPKGFYVNLSPIYQV